MRFPNISERWFTYQAERMKEIARDWLGENDIAFEDAKVQDEEPKEAVSKHCET
ncbi:hypothetical protein KF913_08505 [Candidatus Obscuribacterales bacterium]|nr:hypothetical protein [Candidatus Obscuribacterales bacterium]